MYYLIDKFICLQDTFLFIILFIRYLRNFRDKLNIIILTINFKLFSYHFEHNFIQLNIYNITKLTIIFL